MAEKYLLIDAATPNIQCGIVDNSWTIRDVVSAIGDVVDILPNLVKHLTPNNALTKFSGAIYCGGPGSTLGLRSCMMFLNIYGRFCRKGVKLFRYSSLSMASYLCEKNSKIIVNFGHDRYMARNVDGSCEIVDSIDPNCFFLQTKRLLSNKFCEMKTVSYDLSKCSRSIFNIMDKADVPDLIYDPGQNFTKWTCKRHCKLNI